MDSWAKTGKRHLIGPVELLAVVTARICWNTFLGDRVLAALIKGSSRDCVWRTLLLKFEDADACGPCLYWFARTPSQSNISDGPSRGRWDTVSHLDYIRDNPKCCITGVETIQT